MHVSVEYTAQIKRAAGRSKDSVDLADGATVQTLIESIAGSADERLKRSLVTIDGRMQPTLLAFVRDEQVRPGDMLNEGDIITLLSPISGG
jgi:sulfur-carrier protein